MGKLRGYALFRSARTKLVRISLLIVTALVAAPGVATDPAYEQPGSKLENLSIELAAVGPVHEVGSLIDDDTSNNSAGNSDGALQPGETIELYIELRNPGSDPATGVNLCITPLDPGFTTLYNTCSSYGDIPAGGTATNGDDFDFGLSPSLPIGMVARFELDITASNGGPWSRTLLLHVAPQLVLISDQDELSAMGDLLAGMGLGYVVLNGNWDGAQGIFTSDPTRLDQYGEVIWYGSGFGAGRLITSQEHDALEGFLLGGGGLLVTGYDTLGSPSDPLLADLVRSSDYGDGPFTIDYSVTEGGHPIVDGFYGQLEVGTSLTTGHSDHDQAEADVGRGAVTVAELADGHDKIVATDLPAGGGRIAYWNGNWGLTDWVVSGFASVSATTERAKEGSPDESGTSQASAERHEWAPPTPEANLPMGGAVVLRDPASETDLDAAISVPGDSIIFPATGDTFSVDYDPYWWHAGDYVEGTRLTGLDSVEGVRYTMEISNNALIAPGHVDLDLSINGLVVGSFTVLPGETLKSVAFDFPSLQGPTYVIRLTETNTVGDWLGSIAPAVDVSQMTFVNNVMLKNTIDWLAENTLVWNDPWERNGDPPSCTPVACGETPITEFTDPVIQRPGDFDYYCIAASAGQLVTADVDSYMDGFPLDSVLTLFDKDGVTPLAENDDYGSLDPYLEYTPSSAGLYYLRVRSFAHPCCGSWKHAYRLAVTGSSPVLTVESETISGTRTIEWCNDIVLGPAVTVGASGDLVVRSGGAITIRNGFSVFNGGTVIFEVQP